MVYLSPGSTNIYSTHHHNTLLLPSSLWQSHWITVCLPWVDLETYIGWTNSKNKQKKHVNKLQKYVICLLSSLEKTSEQILQKSLLINPACNAARNSVFLTCQGNISFYGIYPKLLTVQSGLQKLGVKYHMISPKINTAHSWRRGTAWGKRPPECWA